MSRINKPGNIYKGATLIGRHDGGLAGAVYDTSDQLRGNYAAGSVWSVSPANQTNATYKDGVIYDSYAGEPASAIGSYKDGRILNRDGKEVGKYTGGDEGGAAGGVLLLL